MLVRMYGEGFEAIGEDVAIGETKKNRLVVV
jgi:hypothetical protein